MKKKLCMMLSLVMMLSLLSGCVMGGGSSNAPYQLKDVSSYDFFVSSDAYVEDPQSNTTAASDFAMVEELQEDDERLKNTYTYEQLAACFKVSAEVTSSNLSEYFSLDVVPADDGYQNVRMKVKDGYFPAKCIKINFTHDGGTVTVDYDLLNNGEITTTNKADKSWNADKLKAATVDETAHLYTFAPTEEMWTKYNDTQAIYVATKSADGKITVVEEYEYNQLEIAYLLRVIQEKGLLNGGASTTPDDTPDTESSGQTPTPNPTPNPTPQPSYPYPFMGRYFVAVVNYNSPSQAYVNYGLYIDENYLYYKTGSGEPSKTAFEKSKLEDHGDGSYTYTEFEDEFGYDDGFSYYKDKDYINMFSGGYDGYLLIPVEKSVYDAIGTY